MTGEHTWKGLHPVYGPAECPAGHLLEPVPGRYQRSWTPCICPPALATGRNGHDTWRCLACEREGRVEVYYSPAHEG